METKRQRKRIDYARMSRSGLEAATDENDEDTLPCDACERRFATMNSFYFHIPYCTKVPHKCPVCTVGVVSSQNVSGEDQPTNQATEVKIEMDSPTGSPKRSPKKPDDENDADQKSDVQIFTNAVELDSHMAEAHSDSFSFTCWICDVRFRGLVPLQRHVLIEHRMFARTTYEDPPAQLKCACCDQELESVEEMIQHFKEKRICGGGIRLDRCTELDPDVDDDLLFRLRDAQQLEQQFRSRFPCSRIGMSLLIPRTETSEASVDDPSPYQRMDVEPVTPQKRSPSKTSVVPEFSIKKQRGRPKLHAPMHSRIEAAMKQRQLVMEIKKKHKQAMDYIMQAKEDEDEEAKDTSKSMFSQNIESVIGAVIADAASETSDDLDSPNVKVMKKTSPIKRGEIATAAAAVNKMVKRRGRPAKRPELSNVSDDQVAAIITSPKRRRLSPNTSGLAESDDDNDDGSPTPYSPMKGRSVGLEPEGASDEDDEDADIGAMHRAVGGPSCDLDEEDDDARAAPAVELNVCRACGLALDSFSEYTQHMQDVHDLALQSPPRKTPSKEFNDSLDSPRKSEKIYRPGPKSRKGISDLSRTPPDKENDSPPKSLECVSCDVEFSSHEDLRQHKRLVHADVIYAQADVKQKGRGRGRKPKFESSSPGDGSFVMQPWVTAMVANTQRSHPPSLLCPLCPDRRSFNNSDDREAHLASEHDGERAFGCQLCGETFSLFYELQLHTRQEHDSGDPPPLIEDPARTKLAYKCVVCKVGFYLEAVLQRHYDAMHTLDEGEQYHCPVCYFTYSGCRTRDDHVLKKHPEARAFKCPVCEARFASFEVFRAHEKRAHISQKTRVRGTATIEASSLLGLEKPKKAPRRKIAAAMRGALGEKGNSETAEQLAQKRRDSRVYKEGTLLCDKCGEDCANEEELEIHIKEHVRKEKRFGCTQCGRVFSGALARSYLVDHIKLEHMHQAPYTCDDCGQRFLYKVQADRHRTVDRDSGVASCRRSEDLPLALPRLVFGCSRCAKIFAGEGAQSRYSEHQTECVGTMLPLSATSRETPNSVRSEAKPRKMAKRIVKSEPPPPPPLTDQSSTKGDMSDASSPEEDNSLTAPDSVVPSSQEGRSSMIALPGESGEADGVHATGRATIESIGGEQVVVLSEDVLSDVRAAAERSGATGGSVVLIQAEDGTLIVASEEQLAELQMSGVETETAHLVESEEVTAVGEDSTGQTVRQLLQEKRLREAGFIESEDAMPDSG